MNRAFASSRPFDQRVVDGLYIEAIVLADEARGYFDQHGESYRATLDKELRVEFACESLKVTTRIMHAIAWLLTQRAIFAGELPETARLEDRHRLGAAMNTEGALCASLAPDMASLIVTSEELYNRIARFEQQLVERATLCEGPRPGPARDLLSRLEQSL